jgi:hypothetical protein
MQRTAPGDIISDVSQSALSIEGPSYRLSSCNLRLDSSGKEAPTDYSVEKGCHKLDLIATIP